MAIYKYIFWRNDRPKDNDGHRFANIHIVRCYTDESICAFQELACEMRETFPQAIDDQVYCAKIISSSYCKGGSLLRFDAHIPEGAYPGWHQCDAKQQEYFWA